MNARPSLLTAGTDSADKIGRVNPHLVVRALSRTSKRYLGNNIGVRTQRHALEIRDEQGMYCLQSDNIIEEQIAGLRRRMSTSRHTNMHQDAASTRIGYTESYRNKERGWIELNSQDSSDAVYQTSFAIYRLSSIYFGGKLSSYS